MYEYRNPYIVDFSEVKYCSEIHEILMKAFDFPAYYGKNPDALWDCLTDLAGRHNKVEISGWQVIREKFGDTADELAEVFKEWKHYAQDRYCNITHIYIIEGKTETKLV